MSNTVSANVHSLIPMIFARCTTESIQKYEDGKKSDLVIKDWCVVIALPDYRVYDARWMDDPEFGRFALIPDVDLAFEKDHIFDTFSEARLFVGTWWVKYMSAAVFTEGMVKLFDKHTKQTPSTVEIPNA